MASVLRIGIGARGRYTCQPGVRGSKRKRLSTSGPMAAARSSTDMPSAPTNTKALKSLTRWNVASALAAGSVGSMGLLPWATSVPASIAGLLPGATRRESP